LPRHALPALMSAACSADEAYIDRKAVIQMEAPDTTCFQCGTKADEWECGCGYVHHGDIPPERCPQCDSPWHPIWICSECGADNLLLWLEI
jgi:rubrerythrin